MGAPLVTFSTHADRAEQTLHFDTRSEGWSDRYRTNPSFRARLDVVGHAIQHDLAGRPDARVLDYGGGTGVFSVLAARYAQTVVCVDRSTAMLAHGAAQEPQISTLLTEAGFRGRSGHVERISGDHTTALRGCAPFDLVLAIAVLEYVDDCNAALRDLAAAARPGGIMLITVPNPSSPLRLVQRLIAPLGAHQMLRQRAGRLADQSFIAIRPHGDRVPWQPAAHAAGLEVNDQAPLPLSPSGLRSFIHPSTLFTLRKPETSA